MTQSPIAASTVDIRHLLIGCRRRLKAADVRHSEAMLEVVGDPRVGQGITASPSRRVGEGNHAKARATKLVKRRRNIGMKWQC